MVHSCGYAQTRYRFLLITCDHKSKLHTTCVSSFPGTRSPQQDVRGSLETLLVCPVHLWVFRHGASSCSDVYLAEVCYTRSTLYFVSSLTSSYSCLLTSLVAQQLQALINGHRCIQLPVLGLDGSRSSA